MKKENRIPVYLVLVVTILAALACTINVGGPDIPINSIPVSTDAVATMQAQIQESLLAGAQSGTVTLSIDQTQITSFLAAKLQAQSDPLFTDPQVYLQNGQMKIYGIAHQGYFEANIGIVVAVNVDEQGQPVIEIVSADFGPFPVPGGLKEAISAVIQEAYTGSLGPVATGFRIENITIAEGKMTVTGRVK
jgi:hypothetical protein